MKDFYNILKVGKRSSQDEIKAAYRRLAKEYHPDKGGDPRRFNDIQEAYETLTDPKSRRRYDSKLNREKFDDMEYRHIVPNVVYNPVDIFDDIVDIFSRRFGLEKENTIDIEIELSKKEAMEGTNLSFDVPIEKICENCFGFGETIFAVCPQCKGNGMLKRIEPIHLIIEPGISRGEVRKMRAGDLNIRGRVVVER